MRKSFSSNREAALLRERRVASAVAEHLAEHGAEGLTVARIAERTGIPLATLYRHFPGRPALLDAYDGWVRAQLGVPRYETTVEAWPDQVAQAFRGFDTMAPVIRSQLARAAGDPSFRHVRNRRLAAVARMLEPELAHLPEADRLAFLGVSGVLTGAHAWQLLHDDWGLDGDAAGEAVAWALRALLAELRRSPTRLRRRRPRRPTPSAPESPP